MSTYKPTKTSRSTKINRIDPVLVEKYANRKMTSLELAELTGMNASYLRRAIKRIPMVAETRSSKTPLIEARKAYRMSIADKKATEIVEMAHVSLRTAFRIKERAAKLAPKAQT